ncbi:MAG: Cro/CI family transcriptional regulator [Pseudomonadota bacterium]|nr:Cro/CI family transcriptional regulator [Pseudomonadota bacterium]
MRKKDVIQHFNGVSNTAQAVGIGQSAVSQWSDIIPMARALQLERQTNGVLKFDDSLYKKTGATHAK